MTEVPALVGFGRRIMIVGPTNSGKSTLAVAIGQRLDLPVVHVDLLHHIPHTDWVARTKEQFHALHAAAIAAPEWVMDGNYSDVLPARIARATGIIALDDRLARRYWRYFTRTIGRNRAGALEGNRDSIKWTMIHWLWHTRRSGDKLRERASASGLPFVCVRGQRELDQLYRAWGLTLPFSA
ncbi:Adenylate kinase [Devosia crocina]|uniref:Adenylate kinase n=1 Tax=Devosia crocina TaxID=429728 RepID=A0A1I7NE15_9HYPH|nr:hypothetical protein [Devosia crocina]SFV32881.1 Adenylate kinase [Devosia crocina]